MSFTPNSARIGDTITITGSSFDSMTKITLGVRLEQAAPVAQGIIT
ncbi:IPT/TIG domain-containing protein [Chitinophaga fulva]